MFKNAVFDFDSTLTSIEGLDSIAKKHGKLEEIEKITTMGMNGEITFDQSIRLRLKILNPSRSDFEWLSREYEHALIFGVRQLLEELKRKKVNIHIVTGGPRPSVERILLQFGIPPENIWATCFIFEEETAHLDETCIMSTAGGKETVVEEIRKNGSTVVIGDGMTDFNAGKRADLFIGFGGIVQRDKVKNLSKIYITEPNLGYILDYIN